jgi:hypothetical protein
VLRVIGTDGAPLAKIPVSFNVLAGGGSVDPGTIVSDANGEVKARWTLGPSSQIQTLSGAAPGVDPVTVSANGVVPSDLVIAQGNNQTGKATTALAVQIVLRVTGGSNVPIPGQTIGFSITGEVTVRWTLGPQIGPQTAIASAGTLGPISISAIAN